jgi:hypothetical protein
MDGEQQINQHVSVPFASYRGLYIGPKTTFPCPQLHSEKDFFLYYLICHNFLLLHPFLLFFAHFCISFTLLTSNFYLNCNNVFPNFSFPPFHIFSPKCYGQYFPHGGGSILQYTPLAPYEMYETFILKKVRQCCSTKIRNGIIILYVLQVVIGTF